MTIYRGDGTTQNDSPVEATLNVNYFPNISGTVTATHTEFNSLTDNTTWSGSDVTFSGTVTATSPTQYGYGLIAKSAGVTSDWARLDLDNQNVTGNCIFYLNADGQFNIRNDASTGTAAGDVVFRSGVNTFLSWDESAGSLTVSTGTGAKTTAFTIGSTQLVNMYNRLTIDSTGNSQQIPLNLKRDDGACFAQISNESDTGNYAGLAIKTNSTGINYLFFQDDTENRARISVTDNGSMNLQTGSSNTTAVTIDSSQNTTFAGVTYHKSHTVATLPSASTAGGMIYVSDETGGGTMAFSDGTNWRRVQDRAIVS